MLSLLHSLDRCSTLGDSELTHDASCPRSVLCRESIRFLERHLTMALWACWSGDETRIKMLGRTDRNLTGRSGDVTESTGRPNTVTPLVTNFVRWSQTGARRSHSFELLDGRRAPPCFGGSSESRMTSADFGWLRRTSADFELLTYTYFSFG